MELGVEGVHSGNVLGRQVDACGGLTEEVDYLAAVLTDTATVACYTPAKVNL